MVSDCWRKFFITLKPINLSCLFGSIYYKLYGFSKKLGQKNGIDGATSLFNDDTQGARAKCTTKFKAHNNKTCLQKSNYFITKPEIFLQNREGVLKYNENYEKG
jgi:hypothetical protein